MAHPIGESDSGVLRLDFDRWLKLEFHSSKVTSDAVFLPFQQLDGARDSDDVALGDLDGDGDLDAFVANDDPTGVNSENQILTNDGSGNFTAADAPGGARLSTNAALGDLDGDGDLDTFVANGNTVNPNQILTNDGSGNFTVADAPGGNRQSTDVALGDLDGEGDLDAFVTNAGSQFGALNQILTNDGSGNFTAADAPGPEFEESFGVALGDLDGDGDLDAFVANGQDLLNQILTNDGSGNFTVADAPGAELVASQAVALGDLDRDGDLDAFVANWGVNQILTNNGSGNFTSADAPGGTFNSDGVALGDLDGDGGIPPTNEDGLPNLGTDDLLPSMDADIFIA